MTLLNFENDHIRDDMPHLDSYEHWMQNLDPEDFESIIAAIQEEMDKTPTGQHVITSSWIPGSD